MRVVAVLGAFSELRPVFNNKPLSMVLVIQNVYVISGASIIIICKTNPSLISKMKFSSGMIAIVAVYDIVGWQKTMFSAI